MLPIEKGVPLPQGADIPRGVMRNTLLAMQAGDSIVVRRQQIANVYARAKALGVKVRVLPLKERVGSYRVWRLV